MDERIVHGIAGFFIAFVFAAAYVQEMRLSDLNKEITKCDRELFLVKQKWENLEAKVQKDCKESTEFSTKLSDYKETLNDLNKEVSKCDRELLFVKQKCENLETKVQKDCKESTELSTKLREYVETLANSMRGDCYCGAVTPPAGQFLTHTMKIDGQQFSANCMNIAGHVWTMIQRRVDGSVNFYRGWTEYKNGFGDLNSEFWIGLDNIRLLVNNGYTILRVELEYGTESVYAEYSSFYIAGEGENYRIHVSGYSGTAGDGISCTIAHCNNNAQFSTFDNDNDGSTRNNAQTWRGAWWYTDGHRSNLNGEYGNNYHGQGVNWFFFKGWTVSLTQTRMMLRRA